MPVSLVPGVLKQNGQKSFSLCAPMLVVSYVTITYLGGSLKRRLDGSTYQLAEGVFLDLYIKLSCVEGRQIVLHMDVSSTFII